MNTERLLQEYERISDSPDAVVRLRRFVLDLAVRGKLMPQDPNDEPALELLKRIAKEKARLEKAGAIKKFVAPQPIAVQEQPFSVPQNWEWVRLVDVLTKLTDGTHHSPPNGPAGDFKYITAKNIKNNGVLLDDVSYVSREVHENIFSRCDPSRGDILYIKDGATTGVVTVNDLDEPFSMLSSVALLKLPSCLFNRLLVEFLRSPFFYEQMRGFMKGAAITRVTLKRMGPALLPLPPLAEQHRIVAKVGELMALCDRLEEERAQREAVRDRFTTASLARLSAPEPATFPDAARFVLDALPALTTRPDQIKRLRRTILDLAVRGKLVPQSAGQEAAKGLSRPTEPTGPFELPSNWRWIEIGEQLDLLNGMAFKPTDWTKDGLRIVRIQNLNNPDSSFNYCNPDMVRERSLIDNGSFLISWSGTPGTSFGAFIWKRGPAVLNQHIFRCDFKTDVFVPEFLRIAINGRLDEMIAKAHGGVGLQHITKSKLEALQIPLPPLPEQQCIVAKVDELMTLCDRLQASLADGAKSRSRLLESLLAEALAPPESAAA
jgi:type I restriction enzyme S subunit